VIAPILALYALVLCLVNLLFTLKCAVSVLKLAIAVRLNVKNTTTNTVNVVRHHVVAVLSLADKWQWQ
jgi:hypothetical protein